MNSVEIRSLCTRFGRRQILSDLNLSISPSQYVVLLGPSGCGKTTLLRTIAGLHPAASGEILVGGEPVTVIPANRRGIAMVFQHGGLYPHLTVRRTVGFSVANRWRIGAAEKRKIEQAIDLTGIQPLLDRYPSQLSGGELKRVAIAKAIARDSQVLLLDEPLAGLDTAAAREIESELVRLQRETGITTIHVTHDGAEAMRVADTIAVMDGGRIAQTGEPELIYRQPASLSVARRLSAEPLNEFAAAVDPTTGEIQIDDPRVTTSGRWTDGLSGTGGIQLRRVTLVIRPGDGHLAVSSGRPRGAGDGWTAGVILEPQAWQRRPVMGQTQWCSTDQPMIRLQRDGGEDGINESSSDVCWTIPQAGVLVFDARDGHNVMLEADSSAARTSERS